MIHVCAWKFDVGICVILDFLVMTTFIRTEEIFNVTVGENFKLECPFIFGFSFKGHVEEEEEEEIRWTGGHDDPTLGVCNKYRNKWEDYWPNDGFIFEHADGCDKTVVSVEARKSGKFSYVCSLWSVGTGVDRMINNMTFSVRVSCSSEHKCKIRELPSKFLQWSERVEINCEDLCGAQNSSDAIEMIHFEIDNKILHPNAVFSSHITLRENVSWIKETSSQIYCVSQNKSTACEVEESSRNATIGIKPLMNRVFEGETATFECVYEGIGMNPEYEWWISHHGRFSRISRSINPIINISNVSLADDGIAVRCTCIVSGEILTAWAILDVLLAPKPTQTDILPSPSMTSTPPLTSSEQRSTYITKTVTSSSINVMSSAEKHSHSHYVAVIIILSILLAAATVIIGIFIMRNRMSLTTRKEAKRQGPGIYMTTITGAARRTNSPTSSMPSQDDQQTYETIDSALPAELTSNNQEQTPPSSILRGVRSETILDATLASTNQDSTDCDQDPVYQSCDEL